MLRPGRNRSSSFKPYLLLVTSDQWRINPERPGPTAGTYKVYLRHGRGR